MIGPNTLKAVNAANTQELIDELTKDREEFYKKLSTFDTFGKGWLRRNEETHALSIQLNEINTQGVA